MKENDRITEWQTVLTEADMRNITEGQNCEYSLKYYRFHVNPHMRSYIFMNFQEIIPILLQHIWLLHRIISSRDVWKSFHEIRQLTQNKIFLNI